MQLGLQRLGGLLEVTSPAHVPKRAVRFASGSFCARRCKGKSYFQRYGRVMAAASPALPVIHVLEAYAGAGAGLWGKERLVEGLMLAQRDSGALEPSLFVLTPCALADVMRAHGFRVEVLEERHRRLPTHSLPAFVRALRSGTPAVVHTHGYKANLLGRAARLARAPMRALVASCHAWFDESFATRAYNLADRQTAFYSDVTTVADERMLARFPKRGRVAYVANGLPDRLPPTSSERDAARLDFGFAPGRFVAGFLARTDASKGIPEILDAARLTAAENICWAIAGTGELARAIVDAGLPNVRYVGFVSDSHRYRAALDAFVQASRVEGLSLSLLEAMRAGLAIVATAAGSTTLAVRDGREALVIEPGDVPGLVFAVRRLASDAPAAAALGRAARARFIESFLIDRQHREFLALYRSCARR